MDWTITPHPACAHTTTGEITVVQTEPTWVEYDASNDPHPTEGRYPRLDPIRRTGPRIGRNSPCPCGSGLKAKKCCGGQA